MFGYVQRETGKKSGEAGERIILGMRFFCVSVAGGAGTPEFLLRLRMTAAAKKFRRAGVTRAVFPAEFPYTGLFVRWGVLPVETLPLLRSLAAEMVRAGMAERGLSSGSAHLAVTGEWLTYDLTRTVTELCLHNRYVLLDVPYGGEELCRSLRREYGVSLLLKPGKEQLEQADVLLLFAPRGDLTCKNPVVLPLFDGAEVTSLPPLRLPVNLEGHVPEGCDRTQLFAALLEAGVLRSGQIEIIRTPADA